MRRYRVNPDGENWVTALAPVGLIPAMRDAPHGSYEVIEETTTAGGTTSRRWGSIILGATHGASEDEARTANGAAVKLEGYFLRLIAERRRRPGDDLLIPSRRLPALCRSPSLQEPGHVFSDPGAIGARYAEVGGLVRPPPREIGAPLDRVQDTGAGDAAMERADPVRRARGLSVVLEQGLIGPVAEGLITSADAFDND